MIPKAGITNNKGIRGGSEKSLNTPEAPITKMYVIQAAMPIKKGRTLIPVLCKIRVRVVIRIVVRRRSLGGGLDRVQLQQNAGLYYLACHQILHL